MINAESFRLHAELEQATLALFAGDRAAQLRSAEELLIALRKRLEGPIQPELKRRIVEILVEKMMPAVIKFLGYNPSPPPESWADRLVHGRTLLGLSQKESAKRMGVDQSTLARWERREREPAGKFAARAMAFVAAIDAETVARIA